MSIHKHDITVLRLRFLVNMNIEAVNEMRRNIHSSHAIKQNGISIERKSLEKKIEETDDFESHLDLMCLDDQVDFNDNVKDLADELSVLALYKQIEITTKKSVVIAYPDIKLKSLFRIKDMIKNLNKKNIDITSLSFYTDFDELRCLNNDLKHSGYVGDELANYEGWEEGKAITNIGPVYDRLAPNCVEYVNKFVNTLIELRLL